MSATGADLLRVVYFSRNRIRGTDSALRWEIDAILDRSQANNARVGVTGALIFNRGVFGQVLEGPAAAVEDTFDRIQADERHHDVTVLDIAPAAFRLFDRWSMGYVGADAECASMFGAVAQTSEFDLSRLDAEAILKSLHGLAMRNELVDRAA